MGNKKIPMPVKSASLITKRIFYFVIPVKLVLDLIGERESIFFYYSPSPLCLFYRPPYDNKPRTLARP
jgi:hypothetical protein